MISSTEYASHVRDIVDYTDIASQLAKCMGLKKGVWKYIGMVGSGSQYKLPLPFPSSRFQPLYRSRYFIFSFVDFMIARIFDLKFYFDRFNALIFCTYNTTHTLGSARECAIVVCSY